MLKNIKIKNFKSIKDQDINLKRLNVLIGQNGAGKSNFVSLFKFLERLVEQQLFDYIFNAGGINNILFNGFEHTDFVEVLLEFSPFKTVSNIYGFTIKSSGDEYIFSDEHIGFWNKTYSSPYNYDITGKKNESELKSSKSKPGRHRSVANYVYEYLRDLKVFHFHDTSENAPLKLPQDIDDVYFLKNEAENLAPFLLFLKNNDFHTYTKVIEVTKLVYPLFNDFELKESPTSKGKIILRWTEIGSDNIFSVKQISDGTLRFICLATLLLQPKNSKLIPETIILDEPELGLHPFAIHILSELLKKASIDRQIIIATQSVTLINHFTSDDLLIAERNELGETIFKHKNSEELKEWLEDYTLGELWEHNFFGGRP
jgi:predicted ATPase